MAKKIKILQIAPRFPFPADDGGKVGIANIFLQYAKNTDKTTLLFLSGKEFSEDELSNYKKIASIIKLSFEPKYTPIKFLKSTFSNEPIYVAKHINNRLIHTILELIEEIEFDVVHIDHTYLAPIGIAIREHTKKPFGIRIHNIESNIWKRYAQNYSKYHPLKYYLTRQYKLLKKKEMEFIERADINFAITQKELEEIQQFKPNTKVIVASAGVNPDEWIIDDTIERNATEAVLATTYKWIHNIDAVGWLVMDVMPYVKAAVSDAVLSLIGKSPPEWIRNYSNHGINVIGYVPKIQPYLNRAGLYVAPLFVGAGIRIKILEAMAMGLPVVATSISAEGINASELDGLFIADDEKKFAELMIYLMKNPEFSKKSGQNARKFVIKNFSWEANVKLMIDEFEKLINQEFTPIVK